jgi:hypothetical protein
MMTHCFRHRFVLPQVGKLNFEEQTVLLKEGDGRRIWLSSAAADQPLKASDQAALRGAGFESEQQAAEAADFWRGVLERSFAAVNVGVDFGDRAPQGAWTPALLKTLEAQFDRPVFYDTHRLVIFSCEPTPDFQRGTASGVSPLAKKHWFRALQAAEREPALSQRERLAYDIYSASFFVSEPPDARLMMLMMALETLMEQRDRDQTTQEHVQRLIAITAEATIEKNEKHSITSSLELLMQESISQAGKRLADSLGDRRYADRSPKQFFTDCYELRSVLAHGRFPRPSRDDVNRLATPLQRFVGDLIAGSMVTEAAAG